MKQLSCVIIDDDPAAIENLKVLMAKNASFLEVIATANNLTTALECLRSQDPDLVFLDIILGASTSFDLLEQLDDYSFNIVFTTSHEAFALRAFDYNSLHYLVKPISTKAFLKAVEKIKNSAELHQGNEQARQALKVLNRYGEKLAISDRKGTTFINQNQIAFLKGSASYTEITHLNGETTMASKRLGLIYAKLNPEMFLRVHKSFIVNIQEVAYLENAKTGIAILKNGDQVPVGTAYRNPLLAALDAVEN